MVMQGRIGHMDERSDRLRLAISLDKSSTPHSLHLTLSFSIDILFDQLSLLWLKLRKKGGSCRFVSVKTQLSI